MKWNTVPPVGQIQRCLVTLSRPKPFTNHILDGWAGEGKISYGGIAWCPYPDPMTNNNTAGWKSTYLRDEEPKAGEYILCLYERGKPYLVICSWWDPVKTKLTPEREVMAWQIPPKPYFER